MVLREMTSAELNSKRSRDFEAVEPAENDAGDGSPPSKKPRIGFKAKVLPGCGERLPSFPSQASDQAASRSPAGDAEDVGAFNSNGFNLPVVPNLEGSDNQEAFAAISTEANWPWLRSGRLYSNTLVIDGATIAVEPLSEFEMSASQPSSGHTDGEQPSQTTISENWAPLSPTPSLSSTGTGSLVSSTNVTPLRADRERNHVENGESNAAIRYRYVGSREVDEWYAECFESDGYDSEAIAQIGTPPRSTSVVRLKKNPDEIEQNEEAASSVASSPGFVVVGDTSLASSRDDWKSAPWPLEVTFLTDLYNPNHLRFERVSSGVRGGLGCECTTRCNAVTCLNAQRSRFCTVTNCSFGGDCGNSLKERGDLKICRNVRNGMRGLVATRGIPAGEVIGEYLGHLQLFGAPSRGAPVNHGYRLRLKTKTTKNKFVGIDAESCGGKMRLLNHSCNPSARFHEVQTGLRLAVVAVTVRDVFPNEEVTVSYGDQLWFVCRCGWWGCQHRDIHHLPDAASPL